ncbi:ATP-binding protein [Bdellovibrio svalbardensis]|uniref:histidine kinase n=1 Tax=Bdellovibrio svalbardensis TaxID=2972972 RepID=A0ABT6DK63_9BACT|nr:ATP-binding protein [Bdellovibrio svalbardensis]MDG0817252.1 ATP-binding protein [Bdellovibrio svalbardensis]
MTMRVRLLLFTTLLVLGAMAAAGLIGYKVGNSSLETSYAERLTQARLAKKQALQNEFENFGKTLIVTSEMTKTREALKDLLRAENDTFLWLNKNARISEWQDQLTRAYKADDNPELYKAIHLLHKLPLFLQSQFQQQAASEDVPARSIVTVHGKDKVPFFRIHENIHPFFLDYADRFNITDILLVDNTGTIVYSLQKSLNFGTNLNSGIFSSTALGDAYRWSLTAAPRSYKFYDFTANGGFSSTPAAYFVSPVFDKFQLLGAVIFQISLDRVDQVLSDNHQWKKMGLKETGEVLAFGQDGLLRNNSRAFFENPALFLQDYARLGGSKKVTATLEESKTTALKLGLPIEKTRHYFRSEDLVTTEKDYLDQPGLASIGKVDLPGGGEWLLIAKINREEAISPLSRYLFPFSLGALLLLAAFILAFVLISKRLTSPLHNLQSAFEKLKQQKWNEHLQYNTKDEYAQVFSDFNDLAATLDQTTRSKETLENIMHTLRELLFIVDVTSDANSEEYQWSIREANAAASDLIGIPAASLITSDLKLWIEADFKKILEKITNGNGGTQPLEGMLKKISGERIPVQISFSPVKTSKDCKASLIFIATDISRQKEVERELKMQENLLRDSQALSLTGSFRWEMPTGKNIWSDQLFEILGVDPKGVRPTFDIFRGLVLPEDLPLLDAAYKEAQKNLLPINIDLRLRKADTHELIWVRMIGQVEYDQYGNPMTTSGVVQDVTNLKKTELALIFAKDEALKSSQAKSEFLAHMSHEIRTPMNAIMGMAELLKETKLDREQEYYVTIFRKSGEVLMALINDILDLSKIEAGEVSIENIPFDLNKLMNDIQEMLKPRALEKGIGFSFEVAKGINPHLMGDPNKLRQVLINLAGNSIKFTERGQIRINITKNPTKKDSLMISVSDSGVGIAPSKQHLIFQKFSQADSSITRRYGGTGLGLAISKSLVELMGGQIWFKSREGIGTTFFVTIPLREQIYSLATQKPVPMKTPELDFVKTQTPRDPNKKVRILLADDTEDNRILFTHYLKNGPFEIVEAENGLQALDKIKSDEFDIVFMDVQMPEMDGYAATAQVREWEQQVHHAHIPIIALTAHALSDDRDKSLKAGCDDHITKPFKKDTLLTVIDRYSH